MRLINADEYKKELSAGMMFYMGEDEGKAACFECAMDDLEHMPTIEAEPVIHAHWIHMPAFSVRDKEKYFRCSKCGRVILTGYADAKKHFPYCHCGAKMDEVTVDA